MAKKDKKDRSSKKDRKEKKRRRDPDSSDEDRGSKRLQKEVASCSTVHHVFERTLLVYNSLRRLPLLVWWHVKALVDYL